MRLSKLAVVSLGFVIATQLVPSKAVAQSFIGYTIPTAAAVPEAIAIGPDGAVWFLEDDANKIGRITTSGSISEYPIPTAHAGSFGGITAGPDGAVWFTEDEANKIGRITTAGLITEFTVPTASSLPRSITRGSDGNLWFVEQSANKIGKLTVSGTFTEYVIPTAAAAAVAITTGPDNNLWFTEFEKAKIGRLTTGGSFTEFPLASSSKPNQIRTGPDGNVWFTEDQGAIGRITTSGAITEFPIPGVSAVRGIDYGLDGNLYFTEVSRSRIGRMTTSGVLTEFNTTSSNAFPTFLARGADGNIWISEANANQIAVFNPGNRGVLPAVGSTAGSGSSFFRTSVQLHNPSASSADGNIVFHTAGRPAADTDPSLPYSLNAGETKNIADLLPAMGQSGLGSVDVLAKNGVLPAIAARIFNDGGANGTSGFTEDLLKPESSLGVGDQFVLLVPADLVRFRLNIGVRALGSGAAITVTQRNSAGTIVRTVTKSYGLNFFEQVDSTTFLGVAPSASDSIAVKVDSGNLFIYGATTDNTTQDPSVQLGRK